MIPNRHLLRFATRRPSTALGSNHSQSNTVARRGYSQQRYLTLPKDATAIGDAAYHEVYDAFRWNIPKRYNIGYDICGKHAKNRPNDVAIIVEDDGGKVMRTTFGDLDKKTNQLSNALVSKLGMKMGDRVAILLPQVSYYISVCYIHSFFLSLTHAMSKKALETAMAHIAAYKSGLIAVPLFTLFKDDALQYRISDCGARTIVTNAESLHTILRIRDQLPELESVIVVDTGFENYPLHMRQENLDIYDFWKLVERGSTKFKYVDTLADDPAIIIYTSGTTGPPKGCLHGHRVLPGHMPCVELSHVRILTLRSLAYEY